jgi:hypothetical protein
LGRSRTPREWKIQVTFVPFESERDRDDAYLNWVRVFLEEKKGVFEILAKKSKSKEADSD